MGNAVPGAGRPPRTLRRASPSSGDRSSFDEWSHRFWLDDVENPYSTPADKPFDWFRASQVGGKSTIWSRQVYRWSDLDFEANAREGIAVDWPDPLRRPRALVFAVERSSASAASARASPHLPDGRFCRRWR